MAAGFGDLSKRIDMLAREMGGKGQQARLKRVGVLSKQDVDAAVRADLGDLSMSGWRRGNPHEITGRFDLAGDSAVVMSPSRDGPAILTTGTTMATCHHSTAPHHAHGSSRTR